MNHLLIVSDNRMLARRVLKLLQEKNSVEVHTEFNSSTIFDAYLRYHPDYIIFDLDNLLPLESAVKQFLNYRWECPFIVVYERHRPEREIPGVTYVHLQNDSLPEAIDRAAGFTRKPAAGDNEASPAPAERRARRWWGDVLQQPDSYYLMLSICMDVEAKITDTDTQNLRHQLDAVGTPLILNTFDNSILIFMKKSAMRVQGAFRQVHPMICKLVNPHFGSIYYEELKMEDVDTACLSLLEYSKLCCFLDFQCVRMDELSLRYANRSHTDVYLAAVRLLQALFSRKADQVHSVLYRMYLQDFKKNLDLEGLDSFRCWSLFFCQTIFSRFGKQLPAQNKSVTSLEAKYKSASEYWNNLYLLYVQTPFLPVVCDSLMLLLEGYSDPELSLDGVAQKLGFSKPYVSRIFKQHTGLSLVEFLQKLRIEHARRILTVSNETIKSISIKVGYMDTLYFSRLFKRHCGIYPTEYRAESRKGEAYESSGENSTNCGGTANAEGTGNSAE